VVQLTNLWYVQGQNGVSSYLTRRLGHEIFEKNVYYSGIEETVTHAVDDSCTARERARKRAPTRKLSTFGYLHERVQVHGPYTPSVAVSD